MWKDTNQDKFRTISVKVKFEFLNKFDYYELPKQIMFIKQCDPSNKK